MKLYVTLNCNIFLKLRCGKLSTAIQTTVNIGMFQSDYLYCLNFILETTVFLFSYQIMTL